MLDAAIATLLAALSLVVDLGHCARFQATPHGIRCAEVTLDAMCAVEGWHLFGDGTPVCVRGCGPEGIPTS